MPDTTQPSVYWYWINDNISKEGVVNDLIAMKKVNINRAFIGLIGMDEYHSYSIVNRVSPEFWNLLLSALKSEGEL